jgi:hypothetical protein
MAMDLLVERINGVRVKSRRVVLAPSLVVRSTTAPPPRERVARARAKAAPARGARVASKAR